MSPSKPLSGPMEFQILRTRHPPVTYLEQVALLHTEEGYSATASEIKRRIEILPKSDRLLLAVSGEHLIGYAHLRFSCDLLNEKMAEIVAILVRQPYRKRHIGRRLIKAAETWAREAGCSRVMFRVDSSMNELHAFASAMDYQQGNHLLELIHDLD